MRKLLAFLLALSVLSAAGCKPPEKVVVEDPVPLTEADYNYLRARGVPPEHYESPKARAYLRQRNTSINDVRQAHENMRKRAEEKQKKAAEAKKKSNSWLGN